MAENVIEFEHVSKRYSSTLAVNDLSGAVKRGSVFGFLGPNGAGKTTTIRMLLDLIRPTAGAIRVNGEEVGTHSVASRTHMGYIPGELSLPARYTGIEFLQHMASLRGGVPQKTIDDLGERLDAHLHKHIGDLSRGNKQKVGLIQALMHNPDVLVLDEPTSGLDPIMQNEFLSIVRERTDAGATVFLSSHLLHEVQHIATDVGIIKDGALVGVESVSDLHRHSVRRIEITFDGPVDAGVFESVDGLSAVELDGPMLTCTMTGSDDALIKTVAQFNVKTYLAHEPDLDEVFLNFYENGKN